MSYMFSKRYFYLAIGLVLFFGGTNSNCTRMELIAPHGFEVSHESEAITFAVIGDYGQHGANEEAVANMVKSWNPNFIITTGDNNYDYGEASTLQANIGDYYGSYIYNFDAPNEYVCDGSTRRTKMNRFFPSPGNHDVNDRDGLIPYLNYFTLPGKEINYHFIWGPVSFYSLNSTADDMDEQHTWLQKQLETDAQPFHFVYFHHSPYSPARHGNCEKMQWDFRGMGVDVVLTGHDHLYARMEKQGEEGLYYIINGAGGRSLYSCNATTLDSNIILDNCYDANYGAIRGSTNSKQLTLEFFAVHDTITPVDRVVLNKDDRSR